MQQERRKYPRVQVPLDGAYSDGTGWGRKGVRIVDLSQGGCFIDAQSPPPIGTALVVEMTVNETALTLPGQVVYVDRVQGFAVQFTNVEPTTLTALSTFIDALRGGAKRYA